MSLPGVTTRFTRRGDRFATVDILACSDEGGPSSDLAWRRTGHSVRGHAHCRHSRDALVFGDLFSVWVFRASREVHLV